MEISGPSQVQPGTANEFQLTVRSNDPDQQKAGLDVAATAGMLGLIANEGTRISAGELTHTAPKSAAGGVTTWRFRWTSPLAAGPQTLFGNGNSVDGDNSSSGDRSAPATFVVEVVAVETPTTTPTATAPESSPTATALTPTESPSATPTQSATPTTSEIVPSLTATPSPTSPPAGCPGDCSGDDEVTVDELVRGVNIAIGTLSISECPAFDVNNDGEVTVDELVRGVNSALNGCAS